MIGTVLTLVTMAYAGHAAYKRNKMNVQIRGDYMEVRFKLYDKDEFYEVMDFVKSLDDTASFRKTGGDAYWLLKKRPTVIRKLEDRGFQIYRHFQEDTVSFDRDKFYANAPWKGQKVTQTMELWKGSGKNMWRFQRESLQFLKWRGGVGVIGHQMSLGKTVIGLTFLREAAEHMPALIVVPASVKEQWKEEWEKLLHQRVHVIYGKTPYRIPAGTNCIINYDILFDWKKELLRAKFKTMIADEFHKCGSMKAQRTRAYRSIAAKAENFIPMSGTAIRSKPSQFFPTLNLIAPDKFPSMEIFKDRYCEFEVNSYTGHLKETKGVRNEGELQKLLAELMFRKERTDKDVEEDIGIKGNRGKRISVPLGHNLTAYNRLVEKYRDVYGQSSTLVQKQIQKELSRSAFELKKTDAVKWIQDFMESGEKLVVFCYHHAVMDYLCKKFPKDAVRIDGNVTGKARQKAAKEFQGPKDLGVFQILSMGEGIDWIAKVCSFGAFLELPDTIADIEQAEMRFDRPGAKSEEMLYYYLLAKGTIDEKKMENLDKAKQTFDKIVRGRQGTDDDDLLAGLFM